MAELERRFGRSGLREFLGRLGMAEHAETMAAEGVGSLEDLRLVTDQSDLEALGKHGGRGCANILRLVQIL